MVLRQIEIGKLKVAEYNPRERLTPGNPEFEKLKRSIETFGDVEPIIWNERTGNIVGGHQRYEVLKHIGAQTILCSVVDLGDRDEKLLNITLNKVKGGWDHAKLESLLKEFEPDTATLSGFDPMELSLLLASNDDIEQDFNFSDGDNEAGDGEDGGYEADPGTSYIVSLVFRSNFDAQEWAKENGYAKTIKDGKKTTVIRVE